MTTTIFFQQIGGPALKNTVLRLKTLVGDAYAEAQGSGSVARGAASLEMALKVCGQTAQLVAIYADAPSATMGRTNV